VRLEEDKMPQFKALIKRFPFNENGLISVTDTLQINPSTVLNLVIGHVSRFIDEQFRLDQKEKEKLLQTYLKFIEINLVARKFK